MLIQLPEELIVEVLHWLPTRSLALVMRANKQLYRIGRENELWTEHREFPYRMPDPLKRSPSLNDISKNTKPDARLCHSAVVYGDSMYIVGGHNTTEGSQRFNEVKNDFWRFNLVSKMWEPLSEVPFPQRTEHSAVVWGDRMYMFGGFAGLSFTNEIVCYDFVEKKLVPLNPTGDLPPPRSAHIAVAAHGKMWVFGGWNGESQNNDMYAFDFATHEWQQVRCPDMPAARCSHGGTYSPRADALYVYGGYGGPVNQYMSDLWEFSFATMRWTCLPKLTARSRMRMAEHNGKLYVYGGWNSVVHFCDFHEYDIKRGVWRAIDVGFDADSRNGEGKTGQYSACVFNKVLYVFGGFDAAKNDSTNDTRSFRLGRPDFSELAIQCE